MRVSAGDETYEIRAQQSHIEGLITSFFLHQSLYVSHRAARLYGEVGKSTASKVAAILKQLGLDDWVQLVAYLTPALKAVAEDSGRAALMQMAITDAKAFDLLNDRAIDFARERAAELVGMKWVDDRLVPNPNPRWAITDSTRDWLRETITEAFVEGDAPHQLAQKIQDSYLFSAPRARTIARTELAFAHVHGTLDGWKASGQVTHKQWILGSEHDDDVPEGDQCDLYASMPAIPLDSDWDGDIGPPAHPNCVCAVVSVLSDEPSR